MWAAISRSSPPMYLPPMNTAGNCAGGAADADLPSGRAGPPVNSSITAFSSRSSSTSHTAGFTPSPSSSRLTTWHMQHPRRLSTSTGLSDTRLRIPPTLAEATAVLPPPPLVTLPAPALLLVVVDVVLLPESGLSKEDWPRKEAELPRPVTGSHALRLLLYGIACCIAAEFSGWSFTLASALRVSRFLP